MLYLSIVHLILFQIIIIYSLVHFYLSKPLKISNVIANIRYNEIPKDFTVINEIGVICRKFDNVKYFDVAGDLLFEYSWCE